MIKAMILGVGFVALLNTDAVAQSPPDPRDHYASNAMQWGADHIEAMARFSVSALECGAWSADEEAAFRSKYALATYHQLRGEDQHFARALYEAGAAHARHSFESNPKWECKMFTAQHVIDDLRALIAGTDSFWKP